MVHHFKGRIETIFIGLLILSVSCPQYELLEKVGYHEIKRIGILAVVAAFKGVFLFHLPQISPEISNGLQTQTMVHI